MADKTDLEVVARGIQLAIAHSEINLEKVSSKLDARFRGLGSKTLPEYQEAIEAIRKYQGALIEKFKAGYNSPE